MEGLVQSQKEAPLGIVGWARWERDANGNIIGVKDTTLHIPGMLSILVSGDFLHPGLASQTEVTGLAQLPSMELLRARHPDLSDADLAKIRPRYWPNVPVLFQTYHLMIGIGVLLTAVSLLSCWLLKTGQLWNTESKPLRVFLWLLVFCPLLAQIATQAGWFTAELGRQPWIVYEVLKTGEAASAAVKAPQVLRSMVLFFIVYVLLTILFVTLLTNKIRHGPSVSGAGDKAPESWKPMSLRSQRETKG